MLRGLVIAGVLAVCLVAAAVRIPTILRHAVAAGTDGRPGAARDAYRFDVTPETGAHMESLAYYFPSVVRADAVLRIHWGETIVPIRIAAPYSPP